MDYLRLGATLYVPGTHNDLDAIGNGYKIPNLRSLVFCTEDSVSEKDLPSAMRNIGSSLEKLKHVDFMRFIRPRNPAVLMEFLLMKGIAAIDGFVLPKVWLDNLPLYFKLLELHRNFKVMITLETKEVFNLNQLCRLRDTLVEKQYKNRIFTIRIGGLDLLNILGIRRACDRTIYDTPISHCINQVVTTFKPYGFNLSAPAYECFKNFKTLQKETELDLLHGLVSKTAIHPSQIEIIQSAYKVSIHDLETARTLIDPESPAIFRLYDRMCEKATHLNWAQGIVERANIYGVKQDIDHHDAMAPHEAVVGGRCNG